MKKNYVKITVLCVLLILSAVGCSDASQPSGDEGSNAEFAVSTVDMTGREINLKDPVERAVVLTPADCEIIYALGSGDIVVGRGEYCDYPEAVLSVSQVQSGRESNIEQIIALSPQVVFMSTMDQTEEQIAALENAGVTVVVSNASDIEGVYEATRMIGSVLDKETEAEDLVSQMEERFNEIMEKAAVAMTAEASDGDGQKKTVYFEVSPLEWGLYTAGRETFMDEIAHMLGLENIFSDVQGWSEVSQEQIISRNPDYIVTITMYFDEGPLPEEEIASRSGWQSITAVQEGKIYTTDADEISRPSPRLVTAAEVLYGFIYEKE